MKYIKYFSIILIILNINQTKAQILNLKGNLIGFEENEKITICPFLDNMDLDFDNEITLYLNNGTFELNRKLDKPTKFSLIVLSEIPNDIVGFESLTFWAENTSMSIHGVKGKIFQSKIIGSKIQDQYYEYIMSVAKLKNERKQIADSVRTNSNLQKDKISEMRIRYHSHEKIINKERIEFIYNNPNYYCTATMMLFNIAYFPDKIDRIKLNEFYNKMNPDIQSNIYGNQIKTFLENEEEINTRPIEIGDYPHNFTLKNASGNEIKFSSINSKIILLDFWASGCGPCRLEHENYVELYNDFKDKGFEIVSVSQDRSERRLLDAMKKDNMTWISLWDKNKKVSNDLYKILSLPTNYLIMDGKIIAMTLRGEKLRRKIEKIINEPEK